MKKLNRVETELNLIRVELYEEIKGMSPSEMTRYMKSKTAPLHRKYGISPVRKITSASGKLRHDLPTVLILPVCRLRYPGQNTGLRPSIAVVNAENQSCHPATLLTVILFFLGLYIIAKA